MRMATVASPDDDVLLLESLAAHGRVYLQIIECHLAAWTFGVKGTF